jgi:ribonuclease VapC
MIVVDSSAVIAIFEKEQDAALYEAAIRQAERLFISAVNVHETGIVLRARHAAMALDRMWRFLQSENDFEIIAFDEAQAREAIAGFEHYSKKMTPKARLNLAGRAAYALSVAASGVGTVRVGADGRCSFR